MDVGSLSTLRMTGMFVATKVIKQFIGSPQAWGMKDRDQGARGRVEVRHNDETYLSIVYTIAGLMLLTGHE